MTDQAPSTTGSVEQEAKISALDSPSIALAFVLHTIIPDTKEHNHKWESSAYICIIRIDSHKDNPIKLSILNAVFSR